MTIKVYTCPHPEDESDAYLIDGRWFIDVEDELVPEDDAIDADDAALDAELEKDYHEDVATFGPVTALAHFLDRAFRS